MSLVVVGTNHQHSSIELREKIAFSKKRLTDALSFLRQTSSLKAVVIVSTCNRVEIYASSRNPKEAIEQIDEFIYRYHEIPKFKLAPYLYKYTGRCAFAHLISVACGLDSLVLGETQILTQIRQAFNCADDFKFTDRFLKETFSFALSCSRRVQDRKSVV